MGSAYRIARVGAIVPLALGAVAWAAFATPARADDAALTGAAAWARIVGNTVTGTTPDGPYSELFSPDGALTLVDGDGKAGGRWALKGDSLCTKIDDEDEECRTLEVQGMAGAFVDEGGSRYAFTVLPGNPKGL